jgi:hypothetical protein
MPNNTYSISSASVRTFGQTRVSEHPHLHSVLHAHAGPHRLNVAHNTRPLPHAPSASPAQMSAPARWHPSSYGRWVPTRNTRSTFKTSRWNICNMLLRQIKHLKHASKTFAENTWKTLEKTIAKHIKHPDKTCNICVKHIYIQISTLAIYVWKNRWNIWN